MDKEPQNEAENDLPAVDISPTLLEIHGYLVVLRLIRQGFEHRLVVWGIAALKKQGYSSELIEVILRRGAAAGNQWGVMRQYLSNDALTALAKILKKEIDRINAEKE